MAPGERTRIVIELDPGNGPVRGRLMGESDQPEPFRGWLELLAALESRRGRSAMSKSPATTEEVVP